MKLFEQKTPRRLVAVIAALALTIGSVGAAFASDPPKTTHAAYVRTDPVIVTPVRRDPPVTQGPGQLAVRTDPVSDTSSSGPAPEGSGLVGTLVGASPTRYIPAFQYQLNPSDPLGGYNCSAYSMAMAIDKATYGGSYITGKHIRQRTGVVVSTSHIGLSIPDVLIASNGLGVYIRNMTGRDWDDVMAALRAGRGVLLQGLYSAIPDRYSGQIGFKGAHAIFIDHLSSNGYLYVMDPIQKVGARWMPESVLRSFAEALGRREGIYPRTFFAVTRITRLFN